VTPRTNSEEQARIAREMAKRPPGPFHPVAILDVAKFCGFLPRGLLAAWSNNHVAAQLFRVRGIEAFRLSIRRFDEVPLTWDEVQDAKNKTIGADAMAIEIYPPADELVDVANMRHLWMLPRGSDGDRLFRALSAAFRSKDPSQ